MSSVRRLARRRHAALQRGSDVTMRRPTALVCVAVAVLALAATAVAASPQPRVAFASEVRSVTPIPHTHAKAFAVLGAAPPTAGVEFGIALQERDGAELDALLRAVSTPGHPQYQHFLTRPQLMHRIAPATHDVRALLHHLTSAGLDVTYGDCDRADTYGAPWAGAWQSQWWCTDHMRVRGTAAAFSAAFDAPLWLVRDVARGITAPKVAGQYYLPRRVARVVKMLVGPAQWPVVAPRWHGHGRVAGTSGGGSTGTPGIPTPSQDVVVPLTLANQYGTGGAVVSSDAVVGVAEFTSAGISKSDLQSFCTGAGVLQAGSEIECHGQCFAQGGGSDGECTLDVQMDASVFQNGTIGYYFSNEWLMSVAQMWAKGPTAAVYSISWQTNEVSGGQQSNFATDEEYKKLGVMGISVVASSGDSGAVGSGSLPLNPGYPSASPYVTCVGATELVQGSCSTTGDLPPVCSGQGFTCCSKGMEDPADEPAGGYASGGGFSVFEPRPSYQDAAVSSYLANATIPKPPSSAFNASNRAYPDVAALGNAMLMYQSGSWQLSGGTSAAAPIVASIMGLMNDWLLRHGKQPLGFANPLLYKMAQDDPSTIASVGDLGTNNKDGNQLGFTSNPSGWDPVTGNGVMHLDAILAWMGKHQLLFAPHAGNPL